jgi:hypothetical protein
MTLYVNSQAHDTASIFVQNMPINSGIAAHHRPFALLRFCSHRLHVRIVQQKERLGPREVGSLGYSSSGAEES